MTTTPTTPLGEGRPALLFAHPSAELYGADRVFLESVIGAQEAGSDVTVTLPVDGPLVRVLRERDVHVVLAPTPVLQKSALRPRGFVRLLGRGVRSVRPGWRLVRRAGRDGVYVSTITAPAWLLLARLAGRRVTVHVHEAETAAPAVVRSVLAAPAHLAHTVVVNSRFSLDTLVSPRSRLRRRSVVLYNGVTGPDGITPARPRIDGGMQLLYIGRLSPRKGPRFALEVLAELIRRGVDAQLDLLGSVYPGYEWFEAELRAAAGTPELVGRVRFLGFQDDVWPVVAAADVVLIPSLLDEPFGNTAVEALLAARPVIASDTSGLREAAGGYTAAQLVAPGDSQLWADAVQRVVDDWSGFAARAADDATTARERHAVSRYRRRLAGIVGLTPESTAAEPTVGVR